MMMYNLVSGAIGVVLPSRAGVFLSVWAEDLQDPSHSLWWRSFMPIEYGLLDHLVDNTSSE